MGRDGTDGEERDQAMTPKEQAEDPAKWFKLLRDARDKLPKPNVSDPTKAGSEALLQDIHRGIYGEDGLVFVLAEVLVRQASMEERHSQCRTEILMERDERQQADRGTAGIAAFCRKWRYPLAAAAVLMLVGATTLWQTVQGRREAQGMVQEVATQVAKAVVKQMLVEESKP